VTPAAGVFVVLVILIFSSEFTIHTKQAAIVERFGKFGRIAGPRLNFKMPLGRRAEAGRLDIGKFNIGNSD